MEALGKTPVNIIQELIGIHSTRKEAYERMKEKADDEQLKTKLSAGIEQSEEYTKELLNELSQFGDAVSGQVDHDNEINTIWKNALKDLDQMQHNELNRTYEAMEQSLQNSYTQLAENAGELTEPIKELLQKQSAAIQH